MWFNIRFSVFPPFVEEFDTDNKSDNSKSDHNNPSETIHVENEKTKKAKKQKRNQKSTEPKKSNSVPRKSSTLSRSGNVDQQKEPTTQITKREFRRSISSDSSLSSRPSSGTRETVAEKILRHHWSSFTCVKFHNPYFQGEISKKSWKRNCHSKF